MYCSIPDGFVRKDKKMELIHGGNRLPKPVDFEWGCQARGLAGLLQRETIQLPIKRFNLTIGIGNCLEDSCQCRSIGC